MYKSISIKKMDYWIQLGMIMSVGWIIFSSFIYFDELTNYPASYIERYHLNLASYFNSEDDIGRRDEALQYAKANGNEAQAKYLLAIGFRFLKPIFSLWGYLCLILLPISIGWLMAYIALCRNKYLIIDIACSLLLLILNTFISDLMSIYIIFCISIITIWFLIMKVQSK